MTLTSIGLLTIQLILVALAAYGCRLIACRNRRRRLRQAQSELRRRCGFIREELWRLAQADRACQTELDLTLEILRTIRWAETALLVAELDGGISGNPGQYARSITHTVEVELDRAEAALRIIETNLRPLIGRVREAAGGGLQVFAQTARQAVDGLPPEAATLLAGLAASAEKAATLAATAPVDALRQFRQEVEEVSSGRKSS